MIPATIKGINMNQVTRDGPLDGKGLLRLTTDEGTSSTSDIFWEWDRTIYYTSLLQKAGRHVFGSDGMETKPELHLPPTGLG
jgi:hypothetical protein